MSLILTFLKRKSADLTLQRYNTFFYIRKKKLKITYVSLLGVQKHGNYKAHHE